MGVHKCLNNFKVCCHIVGIDVTQDELVCCFGKVYEDFKLALITRHTFENKKMGFVRLVEWLEPIVGGVINRVMLEYKLLIINSLQASISRFMTPPYCK